MSPGSRDPVVWKCSQSTLDNVLLEEYFVCFDENSEEEEKEVDREDDHDVVECFHSRQVPFSLQLLLVQLKETFNLHRI